MSCAIHLGEEGYIQKTEVRVVQGTYPLTSAVVSDPAGVCLVPVSYCVM